MLKTDWCFAVVICLCLALPCTGAAAQSVEREVRRAVDAAKRSNPGLIVRVDPITGLPTSIKGLSPGATPSVSLGASRTDQPSEADVKTAVETFFVSSQLSAAFPTKNVQSKVEALRVRNDPDVPGQSIVHVEQRVNGVPVFGSSGKVVVSPSLAVTQLTASFSSVAIDSTTPTVTEPQAVETARARLRQLLDARSGDRSLNKIRTELDSAPAHAELVVYDPALMRNRGSTSGTTRLSWLVSIDTFRLFVDAGNREVLFYYRDHPTGVLRQVFDLASATRFPGRKIIDEATNERIEPVPVDADQAFLNAAAVFDFYLKVLGRGGISEKQATASPLESYVRYGDIANAYWCKAPGAYCPKANVMVYGPNFAVALDVVGHEMTHGIISEEADLIYADEPGAVNESLADLFGTLIDFYANNGNGNWVLGVKLPGFSSTSPLRSMANPHLIDADGHSLFDKTQTYSPTNRGQPDHYSEYVKRDDPLCDSTSDYFIGCAHFNSGILNKFAFLISEGGVHREVTVNGIGRSKLARIAYRALTTQLNASSGLVQAADAFEQACGDLAGAGAAGMQISDCDQVRAARLATGLAGASS
jgi:Zn-dependent metalloprotease